jgi:protein-disulfide isomerase
MDMKLKLIVVLVALGLLSVACTNESQIKEILKKNPDILTDAIKANPSKFIDALNEAVKVAQKDQAQRRQEAEKKQLEESYNNPLKAEIRSDELIRGTKGAPLTLIEYSDFECPFCKRGYNTVLGLLKKYKGKIQFVYKHLPLSFHPNAMPASQYYEAIRMQSEDKAIKFHDELYENQSKLKQGEKYFKAVAKKLGVNMKKLASDVKSDTVQQRIDQDMKEAAKFGFQGTPGFLFNGIPVKGAYPQSHFDGIVEELKKRGKISL